MNRNHNNTNKDIILGLTVNLVLHLQQVLLSRFGTGPGQMQAKFDTNELTCMVIGRKTQNCLIHCNYFCI